MVARGSVAAVSNPNPVEVRFPNGTYSILLAFDTMNNPSAAHHGLDMLTWSLDDGVSWGAASTLAYPPIANVGSLIGPAVGLQATDDGTLFFWLTDGHLIYSRDYGATWAASARAKSEPASECSIAFASTPRNHTLVMNCRSGKDHRRAQLYWRPDGQGGYASSEPTYPPELTDPGCQGSLINAGGVLFTSNAASTKAREKLTIHRSADQGSTWDKGTTLYEGASAYSQLVSLGDRLGVLAEVGVHGPYETISFAAFDPP